MRSVLPTEVPPYFWTIKAMIFCRPNLIFPLVVVFLSGREG